MNVDDTSEGLLDLGCLWDTSIDDITLSQASEQIEKELECENLLENISLSQTMNLYNPEPDDMESDYKVDFELFAKKKEGTNIPVGRYEHFVNESELKELLNSTESKNTRKNTNWSVTTFNDWCSARMSTTGDEIPDILSFSVEEINFWLSRFVVETRRKDGKDYPPKTLYMLCTGLLRHLRENGVHLNFLDEKNSQNSQFYEFRKTLSARMAELTANGVGTSTKQTEPISEEAENVLWEKGLLGNSTGESMLNTVFFYNCKLFGLRAVDEHKTLSVDQFELGQDQKGKFINFTGRANKTYKGGLYQRHVSAKSIRHHFHGEKIYNIYFNLVVVNFGNNRFYQRPLANGEKNEIRFSVQPIGVNKLSTIMKNMCDKAGISGFLSNHSGKRICATALYQAGVPEQEIMQRTGHRSIESVRKYKRPSDEEMLSNISKALEPNESEELPMNKKAKILDEIVNANHRDSECKNTFTNCQVYFNL